MRLTYVIHGCISVARGRMPEATMDVGQGREQAVPAHPALTAFVHPCTADAEASQAQHIL